MPAVLRIVGRTFDVDRVVRRRAFDFDTVHRRGDRRGRGVWRTNVVTILVSDRDFDDLRGQVREATRFLIRHRLALRRLARVTGVEEMVLDFGIHDRDAFGQFDNFPAALVAAAGAIPIAIELSRYRGGPSSR
jgi:hypothetical protein